MNEENLDEIFQDESEEEERGKKKRHPLKQVRTYFLIVMLALSVVFLALLFRLAPPVIYLIAVFAGVILIDLLIWYLLFGKRANHAAQLLGRILCIFLILILLVGNTVVYVADSFLRDITETKEARQGVSLIVRKDSGIKAIEEMPEETVTGIPQAMYRISTDELLRQVKEEKNVELRTAEYTTLKEPVDALYQGDTNAFVLDEAYRDVIVELFPDFEEVTETIYTCNYRAEQKNTSKKIEVAQDPFTVLITGIDTYGEITTVSRSDVNILATVNPVTKKVLLTSIPRDYYVPIKSGFAGTGGAEGQLDKLTHTGLFGADCTARTLEEYFGITVNYYVRVNFSSLVNIVDALNGIVVVNDIAFGEFAEGENYLNGEQALAFSRERYSFESGDRQRGRNQMKVIEGIIKKVSSPDLGMDYIGLYQALRSSIEMNLSDAEVKDLIRMQMEDMASWEIKSISVDGTGGTDYSAVYGADLYVMYPDQTTVDAAKAEMQSVLTGQ